MTTITHDPSLIDMVAANFDLRDPNKRALDGLVAHIAEHQSPDATVEAVTNLATGVGKTYLMAALIDYLAHQGVRNVLVVTPGRTIYGKTLQNFEQASPKYIAGADHPPFVITPDNFRTAAVARALDDPRVTTVAVFTIQSMLGRSDAARKTQQPDENLGEAFYERLAATDDLVVIADEHHLYRQQARKFSQALRELTPTALVGLTATPDPADYDKVVVEYTLGEAIADGYVKSPVIVYRKDGIRDEQVQLADAVALLRRKEESYAQYVASADVQAVTPAMFVVCETIEHAIHVASVLRGPDMLAGKGEVLVATSESADEDLARLDEVDGPDSPVKAIVSVNKLREGWDVKRIAVIVALRKLASQSLTEQILGRGLRLPFGERAGFNHVDQVDLVAHDSYTQLLKQKDLLTERVGTYRTSTGHSEPVATDDTGGAVLPPEVETELKALEDEDGAATVGGGGTVDHDMPDAVRLGGDEGEDVSGGLFGGGENGAETRIGGTLLRNNDEPEPQTYAPPVEIPMIRFPRLIVERETRTFHLTDITEDEARQAGRAYREEVPTFLSRNVVDAIRRGESVEITTSPDVSDAVAGYQQMMQVGQVRLELRTAVSALPLVGPDRLNRNAARRIVDNFLEGAGVGADEDEVAWSTVRKDDAMAGISRFLVDKAKQQPPVGARRDLIPVEVASTSEQLDPRTVLDGHGEDFRTHTPVDNWRKSLTGIARFDARSTEFELARLMDLAPEIKAWRRLEDGDDVWLMREVGGKYYPDFIAIDTDDVHWLIETKADGKDDDAEVQSKRRTADDWARLVRDYGEYGIWRHLFCTESDIAGAQGSWSRLLLRADPRG